MIRLPACGSGGGGAATPRYSGPPVVIDRAAGALIADEAGAHTEMPCPENDDLVIVAGPFVFEDLREVVQPTAA